MKKNEIAYILYSHTEYSDVWDAFFGRYAKYVPKDKYNNYLFIDKKAEAPSHFKQIYYDDSVSYTERLLQCLKSIEEDFIFFQHEDMILYAKPDFEKMDEIPKILKHSKSSFVKLIRGGNRSISSEYDWLKFIPYGSDWIFAIQPSIWKKDDFIKILEAFRGQNIWMLEKHSQQFCRDNKITGYYTFVGTENQRGEFHYDSIVWPYIATAIVKGKWNLTEYKNELNDLFHEYDIDYTIRGSR